MKLTQILTTAKCRITILYDDRPACVPSEVLNTSEIVFPCLTFLIHLYVTFPICVLQSKIGFYCPEIILN